MEKETVKQKKNYLKEKGSLIIYSKLFWLFLAGSVVGVIMEGTFVCLQKDSGKVMLFLFACLLTLYTEPEPSYFMWEQSN